MAPQHGKDYGAGLQDDRDMKIEMTFTYRVKRKEMREREYCDETVRTAEFAKKVADLERELRLRVPQKSV